MTTPVTDGKMLVNALYHSAVVSGLSMGYSRLTEVAIGGAAPKSDFNPRDIGMVVVDNALGSATKNMPNKQGILPANIVK